MAGNTNWKGRLSTVDLLIKVVCFVNKETNIFNAKMIDLNELEQGGQLCWAFPFSKTSLLMVKLGLELALFYFVIDHRGHHWKGDAPKVRKQKHSLSMWKM